MTFLDALKSVPTPEQPVDGDCLVWAPKVTAAMAAAGFPAVLASATARDDREVILFIHQVTKIGYMIIDCTARQFHPDLPLRWVADLPQFIARMIEKTGAASITVTEIE